MRPTAAAALLSVACFALVTAGCGSSDPAPAAPTPTIPSCQANNTASVTFENRSNSNRTYDVVWDGSRIMTLAPTQKSNSITVAASVNHTLAFMITNTNTSACTPSTPTLAQCSSMNYWCTY